MTAHHPNDDTNDDTNDTNGERGAGHPRLIFAAGGAIQTTEPQREFPLVAEVTTVGSAADADLHLADLEPQHAEIRHDRNDEYVYVRTGTPAAAGGAVGGAPVDVSVLRTGSRIDLGPWTVSFYREEFADQGPGVSTGEVGPGDRAPDSAGRAQRIHGRANI